MALALRFVHHDDGFKRKRYKTSVYGQCLKKLNSELVFFSRTGLLRVRRKNNLNSLKNKKKKKKLKG